MAAAGTTHFSQSLLTSGGSGSAPTALPPCFLLEGEGSGFITSGDSLPNCPRKGMRLFCDHPPAVRVPVGSLDLGVSFPKVHWASPSIASCQSPLPWCERAQGRGKEVAGRRERAAAAVPCREGGHVANHRAAGVVVRWLCSVGLVELHYIPTTSLAICF